MFEYDHDGNRTCAATLAQTDPDATACGAGGPVTVTRTVWTNDGKPSQQTDGRTDPTSPAKSVQTTTEWAYDKNGNPKEVYSPSAVAKDATNPGGIPTVNTYTPDNLLATVTLPVLTEAGRTTAVQSRVTTYAYDPAGRKTTANTRLIGQNAADAGTQKFSYFPSDLLRDQTGRPQGGGGTVGITNVYDAAGSMTSTTDRRPDGTTHTVTASYYADQLLRDIADGVRRTGYAYDGAGALTARAEGPANGPAGRNEHTVRNDAGLPTSTQNPLEGTGATADWAYDKAGRLTIETRRTPQSTRTQEFVRAGDDLLTGTTVHNGISTSAPTLASWQYTHDNAGRILTQAHYGQAAAPSSGGTAGQAVPSTAPVTYRYDYDHAGRLSSFADARGKRTVRFDADGNRTVYGQAGEPDPRSFTYRADDTIRSEKVGTGLTAPEKTYTYEPFGGLKDDGCTGYGYDGLDRLTRAASRVAVGCEATSASTTDYLYDGLDRQVQRTANGAVPSTATQAVTRLSYGGWGQQSTHESTTVGGDTAKTRILQYALRPDGTAMTAHAAGGNDPFAPTGPEQVAEDGTGSTGLITTPDGTVRCTARYDAYGSTNGNTTTAPTGSCNTGRSASEVFYRGNRRDAATGQYQLGSRTYDPAKAAFLTPDVYRTEGSAANTGVGVDPLTRNSYGYVNGDPINMADPSGHKPECGSTPTCRKWDADHDIRGKRHSKAVFQARAERAYEQARDTYFGEAPEGGVRASVGNIYSGAPGPREDGGIIILRLFIEGEGAGVLLEGDARGASNDLDAPYRVAVAVDTRTGEVVSTVTASCYRVRLSPKKCPVQDPIEKGGANSFKLKKGKNGEIVIDYNALNSTVLNCCEVNGSFTLRKAEGGYDVALNGDPYPSVEALQVGPKGTVQYGYSKGSNVLTALAGVPGHRSDRFYAPRSPRFGPPVPLMVFGSPWSLYGPPRLQPLMR